MSARSFGSLFMVASCASAALGCYLVSLRVASERSALESVETRIVLAQRDLRMLQTEIGTRGRLSQLERWNAGAFALSAPAANQFLEGSFELARLARPDHQVDFKAPVVLASAPAPEPEKAPLGEPRSDEPGTGAAVPPSALLHEASLKTETREVPARTAVELPRTAGQKSADKPATAAKPAHSRAADRPGLAAAQSTSPEPKKSVDKPALGHARPVTRKVEIAKTDPLAPLPRKHSAQPKESPPGR
ncbi:MAG TPA: hypothetical protein VFK28_01255 [Sphingomicrobium sp.]|nr:hypothetical protein [Sphingomicrobium sp.]